MILNNSGIVHCATRTRGREENAMNMQELLTYVEELTFKTSMFGYDKDEVDIQLDKICDEAEAIILAKEKEIEEEHERVIDEIIECIILNRVYRRIAHISSAVLTLFRK